MIKPVGAQVLLRVDIPKSTILLADSAKYKGETKAVVHALGTKTNLGVEVGHEVIINERAKPVILEHENKEEFDLLLIQESHIAYITNYEEPQDQ